MAITEILKPYYRDIVKYAIIGICALLSLYMTVKADHTKLIELEDWKHQHELSTVQFNTEVLAELKALRQLLDERMPTRKRYKN